MELRNDILNELKEKAPELAKILGNTKRETPYSVPEGYFQALKMPHLADTVKPGRVRSLPRTQFLRYAVAAVLIGVIGLTVWLTMGPGSVKDPVALAQNDSSSQIQLANSMQNVSDDEMERYMDGHISITNFENGNPVADIKEEDLSLMLSDIPDNELESFVN